MFSRTAISNGGQFRLAAWHDDSFSAMRTFCYLPTQRIIGLYCLPALRTLELKFCHFNHTSHRLLCSHGAYRTEAKIERRTLEILVSGQAPLRAFDGTKIRKYAAWIPTRRTIVFHPIKISGLCPEATLRWLRTFCRWRTPVRAAVFCRSPSVGGHAGRVTLPMWRPTRRLGARRYVKEPCSLCEGTAELYFIAPCGARGEVQKHEPRAIRRGRKDGTADSDACIDSKKTRPP